jgi:transcriptional regulator with XRE-family HTH domain
MHEPSSVNHAEFSERLKDALLKAGYSTKPGKVAREFNTHNPGVMVVAESAKYWLSGRSIPRQERLHGLAKLLGVTPAWLLFGDAAGSDHVKSLSDACTESDEIALVMDFKKLDDYGRRVAVEFMRSLVRLKGDT